jgi:hypothetical protein
MSDALPSTQTPPPVEIGARFPFADLPLAQRIERAEGLANRAFVEARRLAEPGSGAAWLELAGTLALFDGAGSPLTQTFGLGILEPATPVLLDRLEAFFTDRGADVFHEVSPLAGVETFGLLADRGYRPVEMSNVLFQPVGTAPMAPANDPAGGRGEGGGQGASERDGAVRVRRTGPDEADRWAAVSAEGWDEQPELAGFMEGYGRISARSRGNHTFQAETADGPIAAGALSIHEGVALFAGASTVPRGRRRGAQSALLDARLRFAAEQGCSLAVMAALPGSGSQRNAERNGFRIAYTRMKWQLAPAPEPARRVR